MSFIVALKSEIAKLQTELAESLPYKRLTEAKRMLALYESEIRGEIPDAHNSPLPNHAVVATDAGQEIAVADAKQSARRASPERLKALDTARMFLANRTSEPTTTAVIYDHIVSLGIDIGGSDPKNNLSAMLSNSSMFKSHGRAGWTLANFAKPGV